MNRICQAIAKNALTNAQNHKGHKGIKRKEPSVAGALRELCDAQDTVVYDKTSV